MRRHLAIALVAIVLCACGASPTPSPPGTTPPPYAAQTEPLVACLGGDLQSTCDKAARVAIGAVASTGWTPTRVWINSGLLCPMENCLFDPSANFPEPNPPDEGRWAGMAEIAFAETDKHAGMNIAAVGSDLVPVLIGYRVPPLSWCSGTCPSTSTIDGPFRLELVLPHLDWKASDTITGTAILSFDGAAPTTIYGSGDGVIGFSYAEVGGTRHVDPVWTADCALHALDPATPITAALSKSGGVTGNEPGADFLRSFLADPQVQLPAGTWDITAIAKFLDGADCSGDDHTMDATVRTTVAP